MFISYSFIDYLFFLFFFTVKEMELNFTPLFSQDSTGNSQSNRSNSDPLWEHIYEEKYVNDLGD